MDLLLNIISIFFLNHDLTDSSYLFILSVLGIFGMMGIFRKCGLKPWYALIPCLREDKLGEAVGMEKEGRVAAMIEGAAILCTEANLLVRTFMPDPGLVLDMLSVLSFFVAILILVYMIRDKKGRIFPVPANVSLIENKARALKELVFFLLLLFFIAFTMTYVFFEKDDPDSCKESDGYKEKDVKVLDQKACVRGHHYRKEAS